MPVGTPGRSHQGNLKCSEERALTLGAFGGRLRAWVGRWFLFPSPGAEIFHGSKDQMVKETSTRHETKFYELLLETGTHKIQGV